MDSFVQYLFDTPKLRPAVSYSDQKHLVADDKSDLDRMIEARQRHGWLLVSRSYSMDKGHGATMARNDMGQAA